MRLSAKIIITDDYKGSTKHQFFHNVRKDDEILVFTEVQTIKRDWGLKPTMVTFKNNRNGEEFTTTMGQTNKYLSILKHSIM